MCDLCSQDADEREKGREYLRYKADSIERMARKLRSVANGSIDPHGEEAARMKFTAQSIIRYLVEEWM